MIGIYASIFGLYKVKSAFSAKPPIPAAKAAAPVVAAAGSGSKWGFETVSSAPPNLGKKKCAGQGHV